MEKSFAGLLRHSRLASYDRALPQVYHVSSKNKAKGNWGLKRNLPGVIRTPYVTVGDLDTAEHQTTWQSGEKQVLFVNVWKENFPNSRKPAPRPAQVEHNVALMTPAEFKRFLKKAAQQAPAFQQQLKENKLQPEQLFEYLGVIFSEKPTSGVVGPTYSHHEVGWHYPVQGRILNQDRQMMAVGIAGIVASVQRRYASEVRFTGDRRQRTFWVEEAEIDAQGRPMVVVRPFQPGGSTIASIFGTDRSSTTGTKQAAPITMSAQELLDAKGYDKSRAVQEKPENIIENPQHKNVMALINEVLLDDKNDSKK